MYYKRKIEREIKNNLDNNEALIVTGMRRVGKTTLLKHLFDELPNNKIWFDFENPLDKKYFEDVDYNNIYLNIINKGSLNKDNRVYVFIDEAQEYPDISKVVKYLYDYYKVKFFLTGSTAFYLKNLFPESLAGRKIIFELFPLDFEEFLLFKNENIDKYQRIKNKQNISQLDYEMYNKYYEEYIEWGGFPAVVLKSNGQDKESALKDVFSSYWQYEIINLSDYRKSDKLRDLILLLAQRVGSLLDVVKLAQELQLNRNTVRSYLSYLQATYFIYLLSPFSKNVDREISGSQKIYFCDNGILKIMTGLNYGQLLENAVFNQLKQGGIVNYYRKRTGAEIDFIVNKKVAFEVKSTATLSDIKRAGKVSFVLKLDEVIVVSKNYVEEQGVIFGQFL